MRNMIYVNDTTQVYLALLCMSVHEIRFEKLVYRKMKSLKIGVQKFVGLQIFGNILKAKK